MKFSSQEAKDRFPDLHPQMQKVLTDMDDWVKEKYGIELTLTATCSTKAEDTKLGRVSDTHRTRRASDVRTYDLPESLIAELCAVFRKKYGKLGALTKGRPELIVYRPHGTGPHLHVQLNRNYALPEKEYGKT